METKSRKLYLAAFLIPVIVMMIGFGAAGVFPFGDGSALVIDGVHQYLGLFEEFLKQLQAGKGFFYSEHALGYNFYSLYAYYLTSPFNILVLILRMMMNINEAVTIVVLLKIGLCGLCMTWYIRKKIPDDFVIPLGIGTMYALSNYILGYYSNVMWLDCVMLLPVLAYTIEEVAEEGKWKGYVLVLSYCLFSNYYIGFLLCVFSVLYFCIQGWLKRTPGKYFLRYAGASILSAGMVAVILLPSYYSIKLTEAGTQMGIPGSSIVLGNIVEQVSRLFYESYPYTTSADQASVNIYCGSCVIFLLCMYLRNTEIKVKEKAAYCIILLVYLAGFHFQKLNLILHGFHKPVGMPNRFAFIFIFLLLNISAAGWKRAGQCTRKQIFQGMAVFVVCCGAAAVYLRDPKVMLTIVWGGMFAGCLLLRKGKYYPWLMLLLIVSELGSHAVLSISHDGIAHRNTYVAKKQELTKLMNNLNDKELFRTDLTDAVLRNEELLYQLNGCSLFSSTNTKEMQKFMEAIGCDTGKNWYKYDGASDLMDMLLGVRYLVCARGYETVKNYEKVAEGEYFIIYKNPHALQNAVYLKQGTAFSLQNQNPMEAQNQILKTIGMEELYSIHTLQSEPEKENFIGKSVFKVPLQQGEHAYLYLGNIKPDKVVIDGQEYNGSDTNTRFLDLGCAEKAKSVTIRTDERVRSAVLGVYKESQMKQIYRKLSEKQFHIALGKNSVSVDSEGVLFLNSFYQDNLTVRIDGKKSPALNMGGFIGIPLTAGTHSVEMQYTVPGLLPGTILSFFFCMAYLFYKCDLSNKIKN